MVPAGNLLLTDRGAGIGLLHWEDGPVAAALTESLSALADSVLGGGAFRRLEVAVPSHRSDLRRAVLRAGFRLEGVRRQVVPLPDRTWSDELLFARLATDDTAGAYGFSAVMNSILAKKRLIAHVLMRDVQGRVLLCETHFKPDWELPGGIVEPGESPYRGAVREVREELGIDLDVGRLLVVDWLPPYLGWEDAIEMIFDGGLVTAPEVARYELQPSEISRVELVTLVRAAQLVTPIASRRLELASSMPPNAVGYTEDGRVSTGQGSARLRTEPPSGLVEP